MRGRGFIHFSPLLLSVNYYTPTLYFDEKFKISRIFLRSPPGIFIGYGIHILQNSGSEAKEKTYTNLNCFLSRTFRLLCAYLRFWYPSVILTAIPYTGYNVYKHSHFRVWVGFYLCKTGPDAGDGGSQRPFEREWILVRPKGRQERWRLTYLKIVNLNFGFNTSYF